MLRRFLALSLFAISSVSFADTVDISLSNSAAQFKLGVTSGIAGKSDLFAAFMYNDANSMLGEAGLLVLNEEGSVPGLSLGIGAKAVFASLNKIAASRKTVSGVALGGQLRYEVPANRRLAFVGEYHYAPKIISFGDADNYSQGALRAEYSISALTQAYVGYRTTKFVLVNNQGNGVLDKGAHIGVRLSF
jgi:predicted porin